MTGHHRLAAVRLASSLLLCLFMSSDGANCPAECTCSSLGRRVSCIGKGLDHVPDGIPKQATELYLSNNKLTTLKENFLPLLQNLTILDLKNNLISDIEENAFGTVVKLKRLYLTHNQLSTLPRQVFAGLNSLQNLYLGQNKLTSIPDLTFAPNLTYLTLDMNRIDSAKFPNGSLSLTKLTTVILGQNPINSLNVDDFSTLHKSPIAKFDLNHCSLTEVANGTFRPFTKLQSLSLSYNALSVDAVNNVIQSLSSSSIGSLDLSSTIMSPLPSDIFEPLAGTKLRSLKLRHCELVVLLNNTFRALSQLYFLDLAYSQLARVEDGTFAPLLSLQTLVMDHNRLDKFPSPFPPNMTSLDLSYNNDIEEIAQNAFPSGSKLETLALSHCSLRTTYRDSFRGLSNLKTLDMSYNQLSGTSIARDAFVNMTTLKDLKLSNNKMNQILTNVGLFNGLGTLASLNLSNNDCSVLPYMIFSPLSGLQILDLRSNDLGTILGADYKGSLFTGLTSLKTLHLDSNGIAALTGNVFKGLPNISSLYINGNRITHWEPETFQFSKNMSFLDLSTNSISVINSTSVKYFRSKMSVDLSDNPFSCWCDMCWFRDWVNTTHAELINLAQYTCASPHEMAQRPLLQFDPSSIETKCHPPLKLVAIIASAGAFVVFTVIGLLLYRCRWRIALCVYRQKACCCRKPEVDDENRPLENGETFDVTISYGPDHESIAWVNNTFYPGLSQKFNLRPFTEDEHILLGTGYTKQIGMLDDAMSTSSFIFVVMSADYIEDRRRETEMDIANQIFDRSRGRIRIIPIIFTESFAIGTKIRVAIQKNFRRRCTKEETLHWASDPDAQELFWREITEMIEKTRDNQQKST